MDRLKALLQPKTPVRICVVVSAAILLTLCLNGTIAVPAIHYAAYLYSTYALVLVCAWIPGAANRLSTVFTASIEKHAAARPGFERIHAVAIDPERRMRALLAPSLVFNLGYAAFKLGVGIWLGSWWMIAAGVYYAILARLRYSLLRTFMTRGGSKDGERDWKTYRNTAFQMLFLTVAMNGLIVQTVQSGEAYHYPGTLIYAFALYAFVKIIAAVTTLVRKWHEENVILAASRCISFACALMSMMALQTAMISQFGGDEAFARTANTLFGAFVCLAMLCICGHMLNRYKRHAQKGRNTAHA